MGKFLVIQHQGCLKGIVMKVLGMDVGNGKVKFCHIDYAENLVKSDIHWQSCALDVTQNRDRDFRVSLPLQIAEYCFQQGLNPNEFAQIVVCCSHSLSYDPFSDSIYTLAEILAQNFKQSEVYLIRADGQLTPVQDMAEISSTESYGYCFTNFFGSARLGQKLIQNGISLDLGTTTLDVIPIIQGDIDPGGLAEPENYLRFRYANQRIHWVGLCAMPLDMLAQEVPIGNERHQVVPRHYFTDILLALAPDAQQDVLLKHAYARRFPDKHKARRYLAEFVGLDAQTLTQDELQEVHHFLFERYINRVAEAIQAVIEQTFPVLPPDFTVAAFALGSEMILQPALRKIGLARAQIKTLQLHADKALWSASSAFSMALLALEKELQTNIPIQ